MSRLVNISLRLVYTLMLVFSAWYLAFPVTVGIFIIGVVVFPWFFEGALVLLSLDVLFATGWFPLLFVAAVLLLVVRAAFMMYILTT